MPIEIPDIRVYISGQLLRTPKILTGTAVTDAAGTARLYLTTDLTALGDPVFNNVYTWSTDVETTTPVNSRAMVTGVNYVDVTVSRFQFTGVVVLGISVLGSVASVPLAGANVRFVVIGD